MKDVSTTITFNMEDAERLYHTKMNSFYYQQPDRFIVEDEESLFDIIGEDKYYEHKYCTMVWSETFLEQKILIDVYRANGVKCIAICDESCYEKDDGTWEFADYCTIIDEPSGMNEGWLEKQDNKE